MSFDSDTAETLAPVLAMIGQESRLDSNWTCHMLEAVAGRILPDFYRQQRDAAATDVERSGHGLKLVSYPCAGTDDTVLLAHASAGEERLSDASFWISKAIENSPNDGELHRFKASILERSGRLEEALEIAKEAQLLGADADSISRDIERIEDRLVCNLKEISRCSDNGISLPASVKLLGMGRLTFPEFIKLVGKMVSTYAK